MTINRGETIALPEELEMCVRFHGHICPGLTYGYLVAMEAVRVLGLSRSHDEEVVAIPENDSCAVDALQALLGTTLGKGNLILRNYGKNVYTVISRKDGRALRFSRKKTYGYEGSHPEEFNALEKKVADGTATEKERIRQKHLKTESLLAQPFDAVFLTEEVAMEMPPYAPLAPSRECAHCGEMTMATRMIQRETGPLCIPCAEHTPA